MGLVGAAVAVEASFSPFCSVDVCTLRSLRGGGGGGGGGGAREQWPLQSLKSGVAAPLLPSRTSVAKEKMNKQQQFAISAKISKGKKSAETEYPWPEKIPAGADTEGALAYLNRFKPLPNKPKPVTLPFERPLIDLENKIDEVCASFSCDLLLCSMICEQIYTHQWLFQISRPLSGLFLTVEFALD